MEPNENPKDERTKLDDIFRDAPSGEVSRSEFFGMMIGYFLVGMILLVVLAVLVLSSQR